MDFPTDSIVEITRDGIDFGMTGEVIGVHGDTDGRLVVFDVARPGRPDSGWFHSSELKLFKENPTMSEYQSQFPLPDMVSDFFAPMIANGKVQYEVGSQYGTYFFDAEDEFDAATQIEDMRDEINTVLSEYTIEQAEFDYPSTKVSQDTVSGDDLALLEDEQLVALRDTINGLLARRASTAKSANVAVRMGALGEFSLEEAKAGHEFVTRLTKQRAEGATELPVIPGVETVRAFGRPRSIRPLELTR